MKNILMLLQSDFPPDNRVQKEAESLMKHGFNVTILCDHRIKKTKHDNINGINIIRMHHIGIKRLHRLINAPVYPNPNWLYLIIKTVKNIKADAIHVHDLPLALCAIHVGLYFNLPVVIDMHENYPAAMERWFKPGIIGWTIRNPRLARHLEIFCLSKAKKIIVIAEEHKRLLISKNISGKKVHIVENTPMLDIFNQSYRPTRRNRIRSNDVLTLLYFGIINPERGLKLALDAIPILKNAIRQLRLIIIGDGPSLPEIKDKAKAMELMKSVQFTGWLPYDKALNYFRNADIFIMPHDSIEQLDIGVPNKLFEYMAYGKPVVGPGSGASARIIQESNCGESFIPGSAKSFAQAIIRIVESKKDYGNNGRMMIKKKYNWNISENQLFRCYSDLFPTR
ncbi:glycosyltransferase family 4 protein [bacterium]|nr:glycosyltransferase family 4 protein [bacterium]